MRRYVLLTALTAAALLPARAAAQPAAPAADDRHTRLTLEQLMMTEIPMVRGASRFAQQVVDAPASITIITRDEIERFGYRTMADVLRGVRGFYVTTDRNYTYVGARGLARPGDYNTRILLLLNGHRLNDNIYESAMLGTEFPLDLELVDRIEIVRGPSSSLYGTNAFFAVVNVLTRGGSGSRGVRADLGIGSLGTRSIRVGAGRLFDNGAEALFSASTYHSDGQGHPDAGVAVPGMDEDTASRLFGAVSHGPWSAHGAMASRRKVIPTGAFGVRLDDPQSHTVDASAFARLGFDGRLRGTQLAASAYHDWYVYDAAYAAEDGPVLLERARGRWWGAETQAIRRWWSHRVTGGVEVRRNGQQDQQSWEQTPGVVYLDDRRSSTTWAAYLQDEWRLVRAVLLNAGIRHDNDSLFGAATSPRVALILKPSSTSAIKLLHGRAFRAPTRYESYYYSDSPTLRPERITTSEVVGELYSPGGMRMAVSGFVYRMSDLITQSVANTTELGVGFVNEAEVRAAGAEIEAERVWRGGWRVGGSYTLQQVLEGTSGEVLSNSPGRTAALRAAGPLRREYLSAGVETLYTAERTTTRGTTIPSYGILNVTLRSMRTVAGGLSWSLHVNNLLDTRYFDPGTDDHPLDRIQQDRRVLSMKLTWHF